MWNEEQQRRAKLSTEALVVGVAHSVWLDTCRFHKEKSKDTKFSTWPCRQGLLCLIAVVLPSIMHQRPMVPLDLPQVRGSSSEDPRPRMMLQGRADNAVEGGRSWSTFTIE